MRKEFTLAVDGRELATILAALRFHQDENLRIGPGIADQAIEEIASDCGSLKPLDFEDVGRLCERINIHNQPCTNQRGRVWALIAMDKTAVIHACAYKSKSLAEKAMLEYLQDHWGYEGQDNIAQTREWIASHYGALRVEIYSVSVDCSTSLKRGTDGRCNWCGNAIGAEDIKWRGVRFCSDTCLDECRAAQ
jgi:hypothetical protein